MGSPVADMERMTTRLEDAIESLESSTAVIDTTTGAGATIGTTDDAAVTTNTTGTLSSKLRGLVAILADVYDAVNHRLLAHVGGTVAAGATDSGNPVKIGGKYNSTPPTLTNGQRGDAQLDANANLKITQATLIAGEDQTFNRMSIQEAFSFTNIPTQTTTTVKSGAGRLKRIVIPTQVASATVKIYDNTAGSGTVIMDTLTMPATLLDNGPMVIEFGVAFATGLTIVTAGATQPLTAVWI